MEEALRRGWCLWLIYLTTVVTAAAAAAGQQAACEVLDSSLQSTYQLPTNVTLRPSSPQWQLDFVLQQTEPPSTACVRMEQQRSAVRLVLYKGLCQDGKLLDYSFTEGVSVLPHAWTLFLMEVRNNTVLVTPSGASPVLLRGEDAPLSRGALQVTEMYNVEAAVGCRVNCPHYNFSSDRGRKKGVLTSSEAEVLFYFRPGEDFVRLQYEVTCKTPLGQTVYPHVADIKPSLKRWYVVELRHHGSSAQVTLDFEPLRSREVSSQCTFVEHTVRIEGQSLFSFSCNPASGVAEWMEINPMTQCAGNSCSVKDQVTAATVGVAVTVVLAVVFCLLLYYWLVQRAREQAWRELMTSPTHYCDTHPLYKSEAA